MFGFLRPVPIDRYYKQAYARCCRMQHLEYGASSLPWLSYEGVFLYLVAIDAGACPPPAQREPTCCRLRTSRSILATCGSRFAMFSVSVGMVLASIKSDDDVRDRGSILARIARWKLRHQFARAFKHFIAIDPTFAQTVESHVSRHLAMENGDRFNGIDEYCQPTADAFGYVFGLMAELFESARQERRAFLTELGQAVGSAIIAFDCAVDWHWDRIRGQFNPLRNEADVSAAIDCCRAHLARAGWLCECAFGSGSRSVRLLRGRYDRLPATAPSQFSLFQPATLERWGLVRDRRSVYAAMDCLCDCGGCDGCDGCPDAGCADPSPCDVCCCDDCCFCCSGKGGKKKAEDTEPRPSLVGQQGQTITKLYPTGKVLIAGVTYQAKAESGSIDAEVEIEVVAEGSFGLVVRGLRHNADEHSDENAP